MFVRHRNVSAVKVREKKKKGTFKEAVCAWFSCRLPTLVLLMQSMIVKGVSDGGFTWRDVEPRKSTAPHYTKTSPLTYEEADIYSEARGSENVKKEEEVENTGEKSKSSPSHAITENDTWHFELNLFRIAILAVNYRTNHPRPFLSPPLVSVGNVCERRDEPSQRERSVKSSDISRADTTFDLDAPSALEVKSNQWVAG